MKHHRPEKETSPEAPPLRLVFWETTARCNLSCRHCRRLDRLGAGHLDRLGAGRVDVPDAGASGELSTAEGAAFIDDLARSHREALLVFSGGEPLLRADLFDLAARAKRAGLATALATNGTLVTPELAGRVAAAGFSRASVSLDGARAETHDRLRGSPGLFERALAGLRLLRDAGQAVQINMSVTRAGAAELAEMFALAEGQRAAALHIFIIVPVGCGQGLDESERLGPGEQEELLRKFHELSAASRLSTRATCAPQYARIAQEAMSPAQRERYGPAAPGSCEDYPPAVPGADNDRRQGGCLAGRAVCFVSHKGEVFPCGYLPVACGNVRARPLSEIWGSSEVLARLRGAAPVGGKCGRCPWRPACGGCRARAFAATGDYLAADADCAFLPTV